MESLRKSDRDTITKLYVDFYPLLNSYVIRNSGTEDEAKDLFQECMVYLYQLSCKEEIPEIRNLKSYFIGMFKNRWFVQLKKQKRQTDFLNSYQLEFIEADDENYNMYLRAFQRLGDDCREVLQYYVDGKKNQDIANLLNTSLDYAKRKKYLCKEKLKSIVQELSEI